MTTRLGRWRTILLGVAAALLLLNLALYALAPRLRPWLVRESNARLVGYSLDIGAVALHPWSLTLVIRDVRVRQQAHPRPAVLAVPRLEIDVEWGALLRGRIVARSTIVAPALHVDVAQLRAETRDRVPLRRRGWQRLPELYPLDINSIVVRDGTMTYVAPGARRPLRLTGLQAAVRNIRHVEGSRDAYPSPLQLRAVVFDDGRLQFDGAADFLRHARPVLRGSGTIDAVPLATLGPILSGYPLRIGGGTLAARGDVLIGAQMTSAHLAAPQRTTLAVQGRLMGSGRAAIRGAFRPGPGPPDFALDVRATGTRLPALNRLLRAHAKLDAAAGSLSVYSQVLVRDGQIRGYVKPLFHDVGIYDRDQDGNDNPLRQLYEFIADGVRRILENRRTDEVGTLTDLSGPVRDPEASTGQIIANLMRNAFVEAILPGFERESAAAVR